MKRTLITFCLFLLLTACLVGCGTDDTPTETTADTTHSHVYQKEMTAPNCTEAGYTTHTCDCGDSYVDTYVNAFGHTEVVDAEKEPSCTKTGLTAGKHCSVCQEVLVAQTELAALGHSFSEWTVSTPATCTEAGSERRECSTCKQAEEQKIDAPGHNYETDFTIDVEPTCTEAGSKSHHCSRCTDKVDVTEISANGHKWSDWTETSAPTCTELGLERRDCGVCGHFEERDLHNPGHTKADAVVENEVGATCTENGSYDSVVYCSVCGAEISREAKVIGKLGHDHEEEWTVDVEPTCTTLGSKSHHCSRCDDKADVTDIPMNEHDFGEWEEISAPTCTAAGSERRECNDCVYLEERAIPTPGHQYSSVVTSPTKTEQGYTTHTCSVCNDSYVDAYAPATGSMGLTYTVNSDGTTCTVTGMGTCTDTEVYIGEYINGYQVTAIGDKAFSDCTAITVIKIPNSVTTIGTRAFYGCEGITEITIPESVTKIGTQIFFKASNLHTVYYNSPYYSGSNAFLNLDHIKKVIFNGKKIPDAILSGHGNITEIEIGDAVRGIGYYAFKNCSSITAVIIPDSVTSLGYEAFYGCTSLTSVVLGNGIKTIESNWSYPYNGTFQNCVSLTNVTMGDFVTRLGESTFRNCSSLVSITIPASVTSIGSNAFYQCTSLQNVYYEGDIETWVKLSFASTSANPMYHAPNLYFDNELVSLESITIPESITKIGRAAFYNWTSLKSITVPNSVESIDEFAFYGCISLQSVVIPDSVTSIGNSTFYNCTSLVSVSIPDSVTSIGNNAFQNCTSLLNAVIPDSVTSIGNYAFRGCTSLLSITLGSCVESIGDYAFGDCTSLTGIDLPDSVTEIGGALFYNCTSLKTFTLGSGITHLKSFGSSSKTGMFEKCTSLTSIVIPDHVTTIDEGTFGGCSSLESLTLPFIGEKEKSTTSSHKLFGYIFGSKSYNGCSQTEQYYDFRDDRGWYSSFYYIPTSLTTVTITGGNIPSGAFYNCQSLISITLPDTTTGIGTHAFYRCTSLINIMIPDSVTQIGNYAFSECSALANVTIGSSVETIGKYAFSVCKSLTGITIPNSVTSIGERAFISCTSLTNVVIGDSVTTIGEYAFSSCKALTNLTIGSSVTSIERFAFSTCTSLTNVIISDSVTSIGNSAFANCTALTGVVIGNSVTTIGEDAFSKCSLLASVTMGNAIASIGEDAFVDCTSLKDVYYEGDLEQWLSITFAFSPMKYGASLYFNGVLVTSITIPSSFTSINDHAFSGCTSLISVEIPSSVITIGNAAFSRCTSLTNVTIPNSVITIGGYAFLNCVSLTSIVIPDSVTSIESGAFSGCENLSNVILGNSLTTISDRVFLNCSSLAILTIPDSVTSIGAYAFQGCNALTSVTLENTTGWRLYEGDKSGRYDEISEGYLSKPTWAAQLLRTTRGGNYLKRV